MARRRSAWACAAQSLVEIEVPWPNASVRPPPLEPGEETTVPVGAFALLEMLVPVLRRGYVLLIDYGSVEGPAGPVHGYRDHREVADVLADPGGTDITAGVDVSMVAERARSVGLRAFEPVSQQAALRALGHDRWERTMRATQIGAPAGGTRRRGRARLGGTQPREPARRPRGVRRVLVARPRDRGAARAAVARARAHRRRTARGAIGSNEGKSYYGPGGVWFNRQT